MITIKKGESSIDIYFNDPNIYTNKLFARNININNEILEFDFTHYSKRKYNDLSDNDFKLLTKSYNNINQIIINDDTVKKKLKSKNLTNIKLLIKNNLHTIFKINNYNNGIITK